MDAELVIVGAGPAGVSAALWARSRDLDPVLFEGSSSAGGQLHYIHFHPTELLGVAEGDGAAVAASLMRQLRDAGIATRFCAPVKSLTASPSTGRPVIALADGTQVRAQALLIATGARRRRLGVPGDRELEGRGVSYSATRDRDQLRGKRVAVIGGGDAAFENALILVAEGCTVTIVARGTPRARPEFKDRVARERAITVRDHAEVSAVLGDTAVTGVRIGAEDLAVDAIVVKIGEVPNTEWCREAVRVDAGGYVAVDPQCRTSADRVWAAGDVIRPPIPAIAVAAGAAALAIADIRAVLRP